MFRLLIYALFLVILGACKPLYQVSDTKPSHYELKQAKNDSTALLSLLPYKQKLDLEMKQIIAYSDSNLTKDGFESSLGNFVAMCVEEYINIHKKEYAGNSIIILNRGGLRNNLSKGEITKGHIFELMPFDNEIVIVKITGEKLMECITTMLKDKKLFSWNLLMKVKDYTPTDIRVYIKPFDLNETYYVVTTDYLAMGGDNCGFFAKPILYESTKVKLRDAIITYCDSLTKNNRHIRPFRFEQIRISK